MCKQLLIKFNVLTEVNLTMKAKLSIATRVYNNKQALANENKA